MTPRTSRLTGGFLQLVLRLSSQVSSCGDSVTGCRSGGMDHLPQVGDGERVFALFSSASPSFGPASRHSLSSSPTFKSSEHCVRAQHVSSKDASKTFIQCPSTGHDDERFTVHGVQFAYSEGVVTPFFKHTRTHGGPIRPGLLVRIHYLGTNECASIVKLEVKR